MLRFAIVGSGYRSLFYVRIAKALPEEFELLCMLCRTPEKAEKMSAENDIYTTCSEEEMLSMKPDFIVSAVNKASMNKVALHYGKLGFPVISETPAALDFDALCNTFYETQNGVKLTVAEQYIRYASYRKIIDVIESGLIGDVVSIHLSSMHDYHGASVIRHMLGIGLSNVKITGKAFMTDVTNTKTRYETITDGSISAKEERHLVLEYENGKVAFYDFMSDQYRSPIRNKHILVRGTRGEICDDIVYYLDENNLGARKTIEFVNPYEARGLNEDEAAIASMMLDMKMYKEDGVNAYPIEEALEDAYISLLMEEAVKNPYKTVCSAMRPWKK